jgi:hypothetical protein
MSNISPSAILAAAAYSTESSTDLYHDLSLDDQHTRRAIAAALLDEIRTIGRPGLTNESAHALDKWLIGTAKAHGHTLDDDTAAAWVRTAANLASTLGLGF